jgi:2-deoxy-D-gluconate 3-dehydrogenase
MNTNVKGPFFLTQKLLPLLRMAASADSPARVVNVGSIDGIKTPGFDNFSYGPSKAAIHHLTRVLGAQLVGEHIIMNAIAPGPFPTWMLSTGVGFGGATEGDGVDWDAVGKANPSRRVGSLEDAAGLAVFLCSRASEYIVGQTIPLDGGSVAAS